MCMLMHTCCLTPEEHFAYFQLENIFCFCCYFVFSSFVCLFLFYFLVALRKMGEKECYNSDWVRSGFERGERGSESVTIRLSAIDPRQC